MKNHSECKKQFRISSQSWYAATALTEGSVDEILLGWYHPEGGTTGEFSIEWKELGGQIVPQLCAWDDSWSALSTFGDVIHRLGQIDGENATPEQVVAILIECGFEDRTERTAPGTSPPEKAEDEQFSMLMTKYPDATAPL